MAARVAVVIIAAGLVVFGVVSRRDSDRCHEAGKAFVGVELSGHGPVTPAEVRAFADACRGSHLPALGASFLASHDQAALGISLARTATRREPDNFEGWVALSRALKGAGLNRSAAIALRRAVALNPRLGRTPPLPG